MINIKYSKSIETENMEEKNMYDIIIIGAGRTASVQEFTQ